MQKLMNLLFNGIIFAALASNSVLAEMTNAVHQPISHEQLAHEQNTSKVERDAKIEELRQKHGLPPITAKMKKGQDEFADLSRRQRVQFGELRGLHTAKSLTNAVNLEERRIEAQKTLTDLRTKKAGRSISVQEAKQLEHLERAQPFLKEGPVLAAPRR